MPAFSCSSFTALLPPDWNDLTEEVTVKSPVVTFARSDRVGALQVSVQMYSYGPPPQATADLLQSLLEDFAKSE